MFRASTVLIHMYPSVLYLIACPLCALATSFSSAHCIRVKRPIFDTMSSYRSVLIQRSVDVAETECRIQAKTFVQKKSMTFVR